MAAGNPVIRCPASRVHQDYCFLSYFFTWSVICYNIEKMPSCYSIICESLRGIVAAFPCNLWIDIYYATKECFCNAVAALKLRNKGTVNLLRITIPGRSPDISRVKDLFVTISISQSKFAVSRLCCCVTGPVQTIPLVCIIYHGRRENIDSTFPSINSKIYWACSTLYIIHEEYKQAERELEMKELGESCTWCGCDRG